MPEVIVWATEAPIHPSQKHLITSVLYTCLGLYKNSQNACIYIISSSPFKKATWQLFYRLESGDHGELSDSSVVKSPHVAQLGFRNLHFLTVIGEVVCLFKLKLY